MKVGLIFSLLFPNLCLGKYLLVETEDDGEIVPGNKIEDANELIWEDTGLDWDRFRPDDHVDDKEDDVPMEITEDPAWVFGPSPAQNINSNRYKQGCHKHKCNG